MEAKKKPLEGLAKAADHIVGEIFLGTIGRIAYHTAQVPVIGTGLRYVGENLRDGYNAAAESAVRKACANAIVEATRKSGKPVSSEMLSGMAKQFGIPESSLADVRTLVEKQMEPKSEKANGSAFPSPRPVIAPA